MLRDAETAHRRDVASEEHRDAELPEAVPRQRGAESLRALQVWQSQQQEEQSIWEQLALPAEQQVGAWVRHADELEAATERAVEGQLAPVRVAVLRL